MHLAVISEMTDIRCQEELHS